MDRDDLVSPYLPIGITMTIADLHMTRFGQRILGIPVKPRAARGFRKHVRRMKAKKNV